MALRNLLITILLALLLPLAACGTTEEAAPAASGALIAGASPSPGSEETVAAVATAAATETSLPNSTPSPAPSATPLPATSAPSATAEPASAPTESPSMTPTALPPGWYGPGHYPLGMNPLTGTMVDDPALLQRRPIAIKVSNYPAIVRPQAGLNNADLVFEHYAEGGVTRFTAVFYGQDAHTVGSVRSARIIDFEIPVMYDAAFGFSGAAGPNKERFGETEWFNRIISPDFGHKGFYRAQVEDPDIDFWHTMFTDTYRLREILQARGEDVPPTFQNGMIFSETPPAGGTPAGQVEIGYRGSYVTWWYDTGTGRYYRWNDGERHDDANTDQQINFKNVAVIAAQHVDTWIPETEVGQGAKSIEIQIWGEGPASVFRDGQRFDGRWHRENPGDMLTFTDLDGNPLPLGQGNTWFELVPLGFDKLYVTS
jgi:hypothetical protein